MTISQLLNTPIKFGNRKPYICTEDQAIKNLELAAIKLVKGARWSPYHTKVNELRKPLLQLKLARRIQKT